MSSDANPFNWILQELKNGDLRDAEAIVKALQCVAEAIEESKPGRPSVAIHSIDDIHLELNDMHSELSDVVSELRTLNAHLISGSGR